MPIRTITQRVIRNARRRGVKVYTRRQWGSQHRDVYAERRRLTKAGHWGPYRLDADTVVQHITVTKRSGDLRVDARQVEQIGMERFASGISYNWLVDMVTGQVALGQSLDAKGTHTVNDKGVPGFSHDQNMVARAIAVVGMPTDSLSAKAERAIAELIAAMIDEGAVTKGFDYEPHSFFAAKDCPCDSTRNRMPAIKAEALRLVKKQEAVR